MDLIYANANHEDLGVLMDYKMDLAYGRDENDFELTMPSQAHCCGSGFFLYVEGTEYGGIIDSIFTDTTRDEIKYLGRSWHGILNSKILQPDSGRDYLVLSGECNSVMRVIISRLSLNELFTVSAENSGLQISSYTFPRYIRAYDGLLKMLESVGGKLKLSIVDGTVLMSAVRRMEYTQDGDLDSDKVDFDVKRHYNPVNHLLCLGRGELSGREVLHLYTDRLGHVQDAQVLFGMDERMDIYDNANTESLEDLKAGGIKRLKELAKADEIRVDLTENSNQYDVQDLILATDNISGVSAIAEVVKKIVSIEKGHASISYEVEG